MLTVMNSGSTGPALASAAVMIAGNARPTSARAQSVTPPMIPPASATGMKSPGGTRPRVGWRQRISASKPASRRDGRRTIGWKNSSNSSRASARRNSVSSESVPSAAWKSLGRGGGRGGRRGAALADPRDRFAIAGDDDAQAHAQDRIGLRDPMRDLVGGDRNQRAIGERARRSRARPLVDDRHLADDLAGAAPRERDLAAVAQEEDLDLAGFDQIGGGARLAFGEQQRSRGQAHAVTGVHACSGASTPPTRGRRDATTGAESRPSGYAAPAQAVSDCRSRGLTEACGIVARRVAARLPAGHPFARGWRRHPQPRGNPADLRHGLAQELHRALSLATPAARSGRARRPARPARRARPVRGVLRADAAVRLRQPAAPRALGEPAGGGGHRRHRRRQPRAHRAMAVVAQHPRRAGRRAAGFRRQSDRLRRDLRRARPHLARLARRRMGAPLRLAGAGRARLRLARLRRAIRRGDRARAGRDRFRPARAAQ